VPMRTPPGDVIGVLQLINRKADPAHRFASPAAIEREAIAFSARSQDLATALACQAAVALENARLYAELRTTLRVIETSQQQIIQAERLRALGEMAGGVAHDFNNILAVVVGRAQLLLRQVGDPDVRRQIQVIEQVGRDGAQTVRRIQEFARMRRTRPFQRVDLSEVVHQVVEATRSRWSDEAQARGVTYDVRVETAPVPAVLGDPAELRESLMNLLFNALDAMPRGGRVTFTTAVAAERVECVVADTGIGMTEEVRQRVFEPFFTTKAEQGTGLGLSIAYGIVTRHGGEIEVRSRPGEGSVFIIRLPMGREIPEPPSAAPALPGDRQAKVLVIEDEAPVREVLVDLLSRHGHEVVACADGQSGLTRAEAEAFDLVMVDLSMPGLSGWEVVSHIRVKQPRPAVCLITGWGDQIDWDEARERGADYLVAKPFDLDDVTAVVAQALARTSHGAG
jgi:signal transduction histidine kinase/ActR/RegA family two-component response regulator